MKNTKRTITLIAAAVLLVAGLAWLGQHFWAGEVVTPGNDRFGLCFISAPDAPADEARYQGALAAGARWDRWPLYWSWVDEGGYRGRHQGGQHDYDRLVGDELAQGLTPVAILLGTPGRYAAWPAEAGLHVLPANDTGRDPAVLPPVGLYEPVFANGTDDPGPGRQINPANVWAGFVFNTVERYRPGGVLAGQQGWRRGQGVRYWEVWNEPDYDLFWQGSVDDYYRLLEVAYKSIKAADPEATVLLGGLAFYDKPDWFPALLDRLAGSPGPPPFDVASLHHYLSIYSSERLIRQFRAALDAAGLAHIPLWITESGVSVWDDYPATAHGVPPDEPFRATMAEQAAYVIQNSALALYNGVERYYHFMLHDDCGDGPASAYGLRQNFGGHVCNPAQGRPRPAYAAYRLATTQFRDISPLWREKRYEQDRVAFYRAGDRSRLLVLWATQGLTVTATISATGSSAQVYWIETTGPVTASTGLERVLALKPDNGVYTLTLPPATNQNAALPGETGYQIGGRPYLVVERDTLLPQAAMLPLPPTSPPEFTVHWQGLDGGSGLAGYDVWVSQDGGRLSPWLTGVTIEEAVYTGREGHSYGFAVRARDRAGNQGDRPKTSQVVTEVTTGPALTGVVLGPDGRPVAGATVSLTGANSRSSASTGPDGAWPALSLPAGEYQVGTEAPGYGAWPAGRRISLAEPTAITLTLAPARNEVSAGDFEGNQVWTVWDWPAGQISLSIDGYDGQAGARLGDGRGEARACSQPDRPGQLWALQQKVTVPAAGPHLAFWLQISTTITTAEEAWLEVALLDGEQTLNLTPDKIWQPAGWQFVTMPIPPAWQGREAELRFQVVRCSQKPFSVTLDRVSLSGR